jgi:cytochrome c peroxidase
LNRIGMSIQSSLPYWLCVAGAFGVFRVGAADLSVLIDHRWEGQQLRLGHCGLTNRTGQVLSVTRLDFLASNFALRRTEGTWVMCTNQAAFLSLGEQRTGFTINALPPGSYDRIRFHVGLPKELNHADPAQYAAGHPLNPNVNGLHWNWQGGYVFFALEGNWLNATAGSPEYSGYSFHIATDQQLMNVELPLSLELDSSVELSLALNVDRVFAEPHRVGLNDSTATTHSRDGDPLAGRLRENVERAFTVIGTEGSPPAAEPRALPALIAPTATPYRLSISAYFPRPALPLDNPLTQEGVELGRKLFHETALSVNGKQSCASCHKAEAAFTDPGKAVSLGAQGHPGKRNAMPLLNLAWKSSFFWDGRAPSLREQVLKPIEDQLEMHETLTNVVARLARTKLYPELFARAFGTREIVADHIARALEQFLLTRTSDDSKFDRLLQGTTQFTEEEQRGFELFHTEYDPRREQFGADCFHCHGGPIFQNVAFANNGLDVYTRDLGRFDVTKREGDQAKFAVPSLRNVAVTGPYMHDGRFKTLEQVVDHYSTGVKRSATLDPNLAKHPAGGVPLSEADKQALVAFLKTLTDQQFRR